GLYGTLWIILVAYAARFIPFGVRNSQTALMQLSGELTEASRVSGATSLQTLWRIVLPLIRNALIYTWILVFVMAFPELSASVMLQGVNTDVAATALLGLWDGSGGITAASALGIVMFAAVTVLVVLAQALTGRRMTETK